MSKTYTNRAGAADVNLDVQRTEALLKTGALEGTGLGLAMVTLLAELHGGTVAVEGKVGAGSCFTVWLPLRSAETAAAVDEPVAGGVGTPSGALVVERRAVSQLVWTATCRSPSKRTTCSR